MIYFNPSLGDHRKHQPTDEEVLIQEKDFLHYCSQCAMAHQYSPINEYDFKRGWEFGYGAAILAILFDEDINKCT